MPKQEKIKKLIEEGKQVLSSVFEQDDGITRIDRSRSWLRETHSPIIRTYVDSNLFNKWHEKVRLFLIQNGFQDSFINSSRFGTNFDITKEQISLLEAIYEHLDENNTTQNQISWGYLPSKINKLFDNEHYSESVFEAFKFIEDQVRKKSQLNDLLGVRLMRAAFNVENGPLTNYNLADIGERQAQSDLFAGAIGFIKNPKSHNIIEVKQEKAIELLYLANYLLRILDGDYSKRM